MTKDPKGEKNPAGVSGAPDSTIAEGDGDGKPAYATNGDKEIEAREATPAKAPTSARRKEIDKAAASPRWEG